MNGNKTHKRREIRKRWRRKRRRKSGKRWIMRRIKNIKRRKER